MRVVSDDQQWQAPGAPLHRPSASGAPSYDAPSPTMPPAVAPQGWTPPPKPGLVPLRPMTLGVILGASFRVMRRNPRTTLVPALLLAVLLAVASSAGIAAYFGAIERFTTATDYADANAFLAGSMLILGLAALAAGVLTAVATALLQGLIVGEVARGTVGEKLRFGRLWAMYRGRFPALIGFTALLVLAVVVGVGLVLAVTIGLSVATTMSAGSANDVLGGVLAAFGIAVLGLLGGAVLWAWLGTKLAFVPAAIVLERLSITAAIARSWRLTRRSFWRVFGIQLLVAAMIYVATQIVSTPVSFVLFLVTSLIDPTGASSSSPDAMLGAVTGTMVAVYAITSIVQGIGLVVQSATSSLLYLDLRMRREGLDMQLGRYVEAKQAGIALPDPYLP